MLHESEKKGLSEKDRDVALILLAGIRVGCSDLQRNLDNVEYFSAHADALFNRAQQIRAVASGLGDDIATRRVVYETDDEAAI